MIRTTARISLAAAALALVAGLAQAQTTVPADQAHAVRMEPRDHGPGPMGGGPLGLGGPRELHRLLDRVGATDAQRGQIQQLVRAAEPDLRAQRQAGMALRDEQLKVLTQPTVDAAAAEAVRQKMLAQHDQATKRELALLVDINNVFTPEQRAKIATEVDQMRQRRELDRRQADERRALHNQQQAK